MSKRSIPTAWVTSLADPLDLGHGGRGYARLIDAAVMADLSPLPPEAQDAMRIEAVSRALPPFGAELLSTEECP